MLKREEAVLVFIDVQGKLHEIMDAKKTLDASLEKVIRCAQLLDMPILGTEQIPEKLGPTSEPFKSLYALSRVLLQNHFRQTLPAIY